MLSVDRSPCGQKKMSQLPRFSEPVNKNRNILNGKDADLEILVVARHKVKSSTLFWNASESQKGCDLEGKKILNAKLCIF